MRTDLTAEFTSELSRVGRAPVQLLAFYFPTAGTVRVSDRALGPADGLADNWAPLVEEWGRLEDIVDAADPAQVTIEARQMSITLINRGENPFSDYFLKEDPEGVSVDLFQWFQGLADDDRVLIDRFVIADPIQFSERGRLVTLDLVSAIVNMDALVGGLLSAADWPNAKGDDVGKAIDLAFGTVGRVPSLCAKTAPSATLAGSILAGTVTVSVHEDLDALSFASAGTIQIGEEMIRYGSRTASDFNVIQRGYQSTAAEHLDRSAIVELIEDHIYITSRGPVQSIENVQVGGYPAPAGIYTTAADTDPARIIFTQKPYAYRFAAGSSFLAMQFDAIGSGNTAVQAYKAYDAADDATAARIDKNHRTLSLKQATINPDRGEIVKAYLAVEHWESDTIISDYGQVWVEGVGVVGRLSRPNPEEGIAIDAEVDIDHGHSHAIGGEHTHNFRDPTLQTNESPHTHKYSGSGAQSVHYPKYISDSFELKAPYDSGVIGDRETVYFLNAPTSWDGAVLRFSCNIQGAELSAAGRSVSGGSRSIGIGKRSSTSQWGAVFLVKGVGVMYGKATIWDVTLEVTSSPDIQSAETGTDTQVAVSGLNYPVTSDKHVEDVDNLQTDNVALSVKSTEASTRSHVNLFDLTNHVNFDWAWFNDRDVTVTYTGSADNKSIYILHVFFDVEYRKRERFFSDDITAEVVGMVDDDSGTYTGSPNALITRPDHVVKRLLMGPGGLTVDRIAADTYAAAGARLSTLNYTIDGLIRGSATVKEAIKQIAYQARIRPFWSAGRSKLAFVEALSHWPEENPITADDYQLNSIRVQRQPATAIVNQVDLFFSRDWTNDEDGPAGFADSVRAVNSYSVSRFGIRNDPNRFRFDLVRSAAMAADLAAFYVDRFSTPSSFYSVTTYLSKFALEKEDKVQLTSDWNRLRKAKLRILGSSRIFGSGKNRTINHVALLLECLRYILIEHGESDAVRALDALDVSIGKLGEFSEAVALVDLLIIGIGPSLSEEVTIEDVLALVQDFAPQYGETITVADDLDHGIGIGIEDQARILDDLEGWRQFGFGGGQFGVVGFGGWITWHNRAPDEVAVFEDLFAELVTGPMAETVTVDDGLYLHSGFGCPIGSGFGLSPWGQ
jgi:hypothetical protein